MNWKSNPVLLLLLIRDLDAWESANPQTTNPKIVIKDLVPVEKRNEDYFKFLNKMGQNLEDPAKLKRYATHEVGHLIYLADRELIIEVEDFFAAGPTIYEQDGEIGYFMAGVSSNRYRLSDRKLQYTEDLLSRLSYSAAAGTEAETTLLGEDEETNIAARGDERHFHAHCLAARERNSIPFEAFTLWSSARRELKTSLMNSRTELEEAVQLLKPIIYHQCFGIESPPSQIV